MRPSRDDITPFLDFLLLTLLALLAITAQRLDVETLELEEPQVSGGTDDGVALGEALVLELDAAGDLYIQGKATTTSAVVDQLTKDRRTVLLRVDRNTPSAATLEHVSVFREVAEGVRIQVEASEGTR